MTIEQSLYSIDNIKKETNKKYVFVFLIFIVSSIFFVLNYKTYTYSKKTLELQLQIEEEVNLKKGLIRNINKQLSDQMACTHDDKSIIQAIKLFKEVYSEELKDVVITTKTKNKKQCFIITSLGKIKCKDGSQIFDKNENPFIFALTDTIETFNGNIINKLEVNLEYLIKGIIGAKNNYILSPHNNRNHLLKTILKFFLLEEGVIIQYENIDIKIDNLKELIMLNNNILFLIKLLLISTILTSLYLVGNNKKISKKINNISNDIIMLYKADILEKELKNEIINSRIRQIYEAYKNDQYQNFNIEIALLATENKGIKDTILDAITIAKKYTIGKNPSIITKEINDDYNTPIEPIIFKLIIISSLFIQASTLQKKGLIIVEWERCFKDEIEFIKVKIKDNNKYKAISEYWKEHKIFFNEKQMTDLVNNIGGDVNTISNLEIGNNIEIIIPVIDKKEQKLYKQKIIYLDDFRRSN